MMALESPRSELSRPSEAEDGRSANGIRIRSTYANDARTNAVGLDELQVNNIRYHAAQFEQRDPRAAQRAALDRRVAGAEHKLRNIDDTEIALLKAKLLAAVNAAKLNSKHDHHEDEDHAADGFATGEVGAVGTTGKAGVADDPALSDSHTSDSAAAFGGVSGLGGTPRSTASGPTGAVGDTGDTTATSRVVTWEGETSKTADDSDITDLSF